MGEAINELKAGQVYAVTLETPVAAGFLAQHKDLALAPFSLKPVMEMPKQWPFLKIVVT